MSALAEADFYKHTTDAQKERIESWGKNAMALYLFERSQAKLLFERVGITAVRRIEVKESESEHWFTYGPVEHALDTYDGNPLKGMAELVGAYRKLEEKLNAG